jgi:hypothetical protein
VGAGALIVLAADDDGDGLTNEEEAALGTDPGEADSDGDGMPDTEEFDHGTDPTQGIEPITADNAYKPWERLGISEDDWNDLEKSILEEINPGGWKGFLLGDAAEGLILDENGEIVLVPPGATVMYEDGKLHVYPLMENGIGGGLVKGLAKILGRAARARAPPSRARWRGSRPRCARGWRAPACSRGSTARDRDREGAAALPAGPLARALREARRRVRLQDAGRVPQGRPRPHHHPQRRRDLRARQRRQAVL